MTTLDNSPDQTGRDALGKFVPGCPGGPGRPQGSRNIDLRAVAAAAAERDGIDLDRALWGVVRKLIEQAEAGDVGASKLLFERLCGREAFPVAIAEPDVDLGDALRKARLRLAARDEQEAGA